VAHFIFLPKSQKSCDHDTAIFIQQDYCVLVSNISRSIILHVCIAVGFYRIIS